MKSVTFSVIGIAAMLASAACTKKPVAAAHPPDTTPVAQTAPAQTPPAKPAPAKAQPAPQQRAAVDTPRSNTLPPEVRRTLNERLARMEDAMFDYDKATIRQDATVALRDDVGVIRDILHDYPSQRLVIEGHCDERGSDEYNLALGDRRARAVEDFLTNMGIAGGQLSVVSYGRSRPVCTENTEDCFQRNRRAHVTAPQ